MASSDDSVTVAVVQAALGGDREANVERIEGLVRSAAASGAQVILPPELFASAYFPKIKSEEFFDWAFPAGDDPALERFGRIARELGVVVPVSFFERDGSDYYSSVAVMDADGSTLGIYRKSHIPEGPGYEEKFYFRPGNSGFEVWATRYGALGVGICWDQWFPECARALVLGGADMLLYPSAIGSEPDAPELDTSGPWQRVMMGHAAANLVPVAAANRIGEEDGQIFYGRSFVADQRGEKVVELAGDEEGFAVATFDLAAIRRERADFGLLRDRRPDLYGALLGQATAAKKP